MKNDVRFAVLPAIIIGLVIIVAVLTTMTLSFSVVSSLLGSVSSNVGVVVSIATAAGSTMSEAGPLARLPWLTWLVLLEADDEDTGAVE